MKELGENIICFPSVPWSHNWERQHELIYRLGHHFSSQVFINAPYGMINHSPLTLLQKLRKLGAEQVQARSNLWLPNMKMVSGPFIPYHYNAVLDSLNERILQSRIPVKPEEAIIFATYVNGFIFNYFKRGKLKVLDLAQRRQFITELSPKAKDLEKRAVATADLVFTDSLATQSDYLPLRADIIHLPTGVNMKRFEVEPAPLLKRLKTEGKTIAGYIGTDLALDYEVLTSLIKNFPQVCFVLVGKYERPENALLAAYANVHLVGAIPSTEVARWYTGLDIGLIPYTINERNLGVFPTKFLEFMASGTPILSSALPDVKALANEAVSVYERPETATDKMRDLLKRVAELKTPAKQLAQKYAWEHQFEIFLSHLKAHSQ